MKKSTLHALCALIVAPVAAFAGTEAKATKNIVEKVEESWISGDLGVNVVSQYVTRGLILENQGAMIQPYADIYFKLYEGEGFVNEVSLALGIWNSFHSRKTDAGAVSGGRPSTRSWYEFDFTVGVPITFAKNFTITPSYYTFLSPNDGFSTFQGLNVSLSYDDTDILGAFALHPKIQFLWELENKAGNGDDEGFYYEVSIAPGLPPIGDLSVSFPIVAGFGSNDFYANDAGFGFVSAGVSLSYALTSIPEKWGSWSVSAGYTFYYLGDDSLRGFNPGVRDADNTEHVFSGGIMVAF